MPKYKIFLILSLSFIFGIAFASFLKISSFISFIFFLLGLIFLSFFWINKKFLLFGFCLIFFFAGILRYNLSWPKLSFNKIQFYNEREVTFEGIVKKVEERLDRMEMIIEAKKLALDDKLIEVKGKVLVFTHLYSPYQYGDLLKISCYLFSPKPIEKFAYHEYLARYNIYSTCFSKKIKILERNKGNFLISQIFKLKNKIKLAIEQNFTEPEGGIFSTLFLGIKKELPDKVRDVFSRTGTAHILAVSGLHVMIMSQLLFFLFINIFYLKRTDAFYLVSLAMIFYVILTGASASAIRAGIMGFLSILAEKIGRRKMNLNIILLAAAIMLLANPKLLKNDIGFQLSYLGILGMTFLSDYFYWIFKKNSEEGINFRQYLANSCSAQFFVFPLILYYFGNLSLGAPIANILVLTILPYLMAFGFIFAFFSLIFLPLAKILFFPIWSILFFLYKILKFFSQLSFFSFNFGKIPFFMVIIFYLAMIYFVYQVRKRS